MGEELGPGAQWGRGRLVCWWWCRLVRAYDHGVDLVNDHCEDQPEYGRQEETADDLEYGTGLEGAECGASVEPDVSEPRLQGWERWCLHCAYLLLSAEISVGLEGLCGISLKGVSQSHVQGIKTGFSTARRSFLVTRWVVQRRIWRYSNQPFDKILFLENS
jgi:hypothetical protein